MTGRVRRWAALTGSALTTLLLTGCIQVVSLHSDLVACEQGDDAEPSNGVILMAQSVPTASFVPCLEAMPVGWRFSDMEARNDSAAFWLDADRYGTHAIEVRLTESCDTTGATEIPSDRQDMQRLELVTQVSPQYVGQRFYLFEGGCMSVLFRLSGRERSEALALATQAIGAVPRANLQDLVREESGGRLELDPAAEGGR
ncbi:hypothetical protein [Blastococcus sp. PRF04-17]|uniref:hypothetical protein n=1 Tax=Blastococcus sp. PRF04-17 TaxID=2933797 RepID=UPI001FF32644|nr:hypothetical protein [Blastococcus sp. PRF04-17]UOY00871.1 hypothetical protein MVA48_18100 [Blastococcus sp. PRF04-17]